MARTAEELRADAARQRDQLSSTVDAIGDRVSPGRIIERRTNRLRDGFQRLRSTVMGKADDARGAVTDTTSSTLDGLSGAAHAAAALPQSAAQSATEQAAGNPLAAGAVAFGIGFLAAAAFPGTRAEQQAATRLKEAAEPLVEDAKEVGQEALHQLQGPAKEAVDHVREVAADKATEVQEGAREQLGNAADAGHEAVGAVKDTATSGGEHPQAGQAGTSQP